MELEQFPGYMHKNELHCGKEAEQRITLMVNTNGKSSFLFF